MSKKPSQKPQKNKPQKPVLDQQIEPCLKAMQKKVRNITKKLTEIADLEKKDNLKPEQIEKINKKDKVEAQRLKYEEFIAFYREILRENTEQVRAGQLKELTQLAESLAILSLGKTKPELKNQKLVKLITLINQPSSQDITLDQRIIQINQGLVNAANDQRLRNWVEKTVQELKDTQLSEVSKQVKTEQVQEPKAKKEEVEKKEEPIVEKKESPPVKVQPQTQPVVEAPVETKTQNQQEQPKTQANKQVSAQQKTEEAKRQGGRGTGTRRGGRQPRDYKRYENRDDKRKYKPKYEQKGKQNENNQDEDEDSDDDDQPIEFKPITREDVRKLQEDGFILVGKPKLKAKDQQEYYQHTHGKKYHHHHHKQNI